MKKLINNPANVVNEMLEGIVSAHPDYVKRVVGFDVLQRTHSSKKVGLISGGGSGHEPSHGGFVGKGMLDAAVAGDVFTSPTPDQVFEGIKAADNGKGVLLVIKNYTGDILNFEMAAELAEADGIKVEQVVVNDDIAVEGSTYTTGRRGIAGTVFIHKIAGAAAERGQDITSVKKVAEKVISNVRTMGMSLSSCTIPAAGKPGFVLAEDEMEIGLGIHGEPGIRKEKIKSADEITSELVKKIINDLQLQKNDEVAVMINGLGATPLMELYIVNNKANAIIKEMGVNIHKTIIGNYMTALEMAGCSITVIKLDAELKELLDDVADTPAYKQF